MSFPRGSVPKMWPADNGGSMLPARPAPLGLGTGKITGPRKQAKTTNTTPATGSTSSRFLITRADLRSLRSEASSASVSAEEISAELAGDSGTLASIFDPWIQNRIQDVCNHVGENHRHREDRYDRLDRRDVTVIYRLQQLL